MPVLALLLGLGTWQVQRLRWKTELLDRIAASERGPPEPLGAAPELFRKVAVSGRFDHAREALFGLEVRGPTLGAHLVTPLLREGDAPVLIDRGWVPLTRDAPIARPEGAVTVTAWVRPAEPRDGMAVRDDTAGRRFYTWDPPTIGAGIGLPAAATFGLVALAEPAADPRALPAPSRAIPRPNNPHLGYAITWYGLAAALVAVLVVFLRRRPAVPLAEPA